MKVSDRRLAHRYDVPLRLRVRRWKSADPEESAESLNISERGVCFVTRARYVEGEPIEVLLEMPEEITGEPTTKWLCTGHVAYVQPIPPAGSTFGVGIAFDYYEVQRRSETLAG